MTVIFALDTVLVGGSETEHEARPEVEQHILELINKLPANSALRQQLVTGARGDLLGGRTTSCFCGVIDAARGRSVHGHCANRTITPEYTSFKEAKRRCQNPKAVSFAYYGGRGIEFRFASFEEFLAEVGLRPSPKMSIEPY